MRPSPTTDGITRRLVRAWLPPVVLFLLIIALWQVAVVTLEIKPYLLPSPAQVVDAGLADGETLLKAASVTGQAAVCGFIISLLLGCSAAVCFAQFPLIRRGVLPYALLLQTVPMIAIAPLILVWMGPGQRSVVVISVIVSLFPIITNTTAGLLAVPEELRDLFQLYRYFSFARKAKETIIIPTVAWVCLLLI